LSRAFVLGNGRSRLRLHIPDIQPHGKIYGCNALYREYSPDYLIAVDPKMIYEICKTDYQRTHAVWTNPNSRYKEFEGLNYFQPSKGWSSGPTALLLASEHKHNEIYIFGFDYTGVDGRVNNVYADTDNYKKSSEPATYYGNWMRQTETIIKSNPKTKYFRIVDQKYFDTGWDKLSNLHVVTYEDFFTRVKNWEKS